MTILFATPYLRAKGEEPKGGGLEAYLFRVSGALKNLGHTPIIVSLGTKDICYMENGIQIQFISYKSVHMTKSKSINLLCDRIRQSKAINQKIKEIIQTRDVDIIQFPSVYGLSACYCGKIPAVMRLSSYAKLYYREYPFSKMEYGIWILFEWLGARRCNAVFGPSKFIADAFSNDIHRKVSVIESPFWEDNEILDNKIYLDNLSGKKYVLFVGRLHIEKGILVIVEMIERFLRQHLDYYFVCCGDNGMVNGKNAAQMLKRAAGDCRDRFIYMKTLSHETLYPIIEHADFVICPSLCENLSNACIEAMHFDRVVIGTKGTSFEQLIDDEESGLLCVAGNADSLLEKMNEAAAMSEARKAEIGRKARKRIDKLRPEIVVNKLIRYYQRIIDYVHY